MADSFTIAYASLLTRTVVGAATRGEFPRLGIGTRISAVLAN